LVFSQNGDLSIQPRTIRIGSSTAKGYKLEDFEDVFARYLPQEADVTV